MAQKVPTLKQSFLLSISGFTLMFFSCFGAAMAAEQENALLVYPLMLALLVGFGMWMFGGVQFLVRLTQRRGWSAPKD